MDVSLRAFGEAYFRSVCVCTCIGPFCSRVLFRSWSRQVWCEVCGDTVRAQERGFESWACCLTVWPGPDCERLLASQDHLRSAGYWTLSCCILQTRHAQRGRVTCLRSQLRLQSEDSRSRYLAAK